MDAGSISIITPLEHLPVRLRPSAPVSDEALYAFCRLNRDLRIERTREGELIIMSPTGGETGKRNFALTVLFGAWVARDGTGIGFDSSTGFILPNGAERSPDVAWVRKSRWEALTPGQRERFVPLCPDFVVELKSPSDDLRELRAKLAEYMENGAQLGWLIDPEDRSVTVFRPGRAPETLPDPAQVSGEPVLPGFVLEPAAIW